MNNINLIYARLDSLYDKFDVYLEHISLKRQQKILAISDLDAKINSLGGALLLNEAASCFGVCADDVKYTLKGKPYIENADFHFSISHSDGFAACSFGKMPSGCDIQVKRKINLKIAERFFSEKERQEIFAAPIPQDEFFRVWCQKESAYKLTGVNDCIVENKHKIKFQNFKLLDNLYLSICSFDDICVNPMQIKF